MHIFGSDVKWGRKRESGKKAGVSEVPLPVKIVLREIDLSLGLELLPLDICELDYCFS